MVINAFIQLFEIHENEAMDVSNSNDETENSVLDCEKMQMIVGKEMN